MNTDLNIGEMARRSGFRASTLRYYERAGLLPRPERTPSGYRRYGETALPRLAFIARAKHLGLPLDEIRGLLAAWDGASCGHVQDRLRRSIGARSAEVRDRLAELTAFAGQLHDALARLDTEPSTGPCTEGCACARLDGADVERSADDEARGRPRELRRTLRPAPAPEVPTACTLRPDEQPDRIRAWAQLVARGTSRERFGDGVRLRFPPEPELAGQLAELAAREQGCCSFLHFILRSSADELTVDVQAPGQADAVAELFAVPPASCTDRRDEADPTAHADLAEGGPLFLASLSR